MGHRSSNTEDERRSKRKKKHWRRSSSNSSSNSRTYSSKKGGRRPRSESGSWYRDGQPSSHSHERRRRRRSSSSSSYGSRRQRSRSRSRGRGKAYRVKRSRPKSRTRRSRSRPRSRSHSRSSERTSHRRTRSSIKCQDCGNIKAGLEHLPPAEQAKARLHLVLEAAAKVDEALKAKERNEEEAKRRKEEDQATLVEQVKRVKEIEAIESDSFVQQMFRSSKEVKNIPTAIKYQDDNSLAHPNLFIEKTEAEEKWFKRLIALRQERLMGSPVA
ncbi:rCG64421 [Rattus norvegicus]|uniref:RCG64421 n=1 Tax=Rattus norvegicus TaxID=10116 RepID=A6IGA2_RAT|nr:rCG64421 [Rattus norvegicus]